jgi:hypothetical protein
MGMVGLAKAASEDWFRESVSQSLPIPLYYSYKPISRFVKLYRADPDLS